MLAQFALVVFAMCAVLSLIIDIGYARLTQAQMQNAADTAALEGLRNRDVTAGDPSGSDIQRRLVASGFVRGVFDDDIDPTNGDPDYQFGAGPIIDLTDGATSLHAFQTMSVPDTHVYQPDLQLNQDNAVHGDMVSGRFCYNADPAPSEGAGFVDDVCNEAQLGTGPYARNDFNPGAANTAFLVRLRRSNEAQEPDIASSGPSLPLVFGKGTMIHGDDPSGSYSIRRDGLTVRATAIAAVRPALRVGLPQPQSSPPLPGVTPFALLDTCIQNATGAPVTINVTVNPATGLITRTGIGPPAACPAGTPVGRYVANPTALSTVGQVLPAANVAVPCPSVNSFAGSYGPVYSQIASGTNRAANRVIGFARINFTRAATCPAAGLPFAATIARGVSLVAASNATANLVDGLALPATAQPADVTELLDKNLVGAGRVNYGPVFVPVLVR